MFGQYATADGIDSFDLVRILLIASSTAWLAWGASLSFLGLFYRERFIPALPAYEPIVGKTAILVPISNEDPVATMARISAIDKSLMALPDHGKFHFAVLSDSGNPEIITQEKYWFSHLVTARQAKGRMFYRHRQNNIGRKAGNIADFFQRSGGNYDYALILDADSLMAGETIVEMVRRMEVMPQLGLLQSLPQIIGARSLFGRALQFSSNFFSPVFSRGLAAMQGREGPFWGHNALVRTRAFVSSCGLPELSGPPPFGGQILSHDYVEAALLARAGWTVRLDPDLTGSFEEGPEDILAYAKRDRRWCQGNLQHTRLLLAPGFSLWSRFVFFLGIMSYIAPLLWGLFLLSGIVAPIFALPLNYFPEPHQLFPVFPSDQTSKAIELAVGIFGLLVLPKFAIGLKCIWLGQAGYFGGALRALGSTLLELALSSMTAPLMLAFQSRSVLQVMFGLDGGWPSTQRDGNSISFKDAWAASSWITALGTAAVASSWYFAPQVMPWLLPVCLPMIVAPSIIHFTAQSATGMARHCLIVPDETTPAPVILDFRETLADWGVPSFTPAPERQIAEGRNHA